MERQTQATINDIPNGIEIVTTNVTSESFPNLEIARQNLNLRKNIILLHTGIKAFVGVSSLGLAASEISSINNQDIKSFIVPALLGLLSAVSFKEIYFDSKNLKRNLNPQINKIQQK